MKLQLCLCHWASNSAELGLYTTARPCPDHLWPCNLHYSDRVSHRGGSLLLHSVLRKHPLKNKRKREMQRFKELIKVRYSFNSRAGFLSTQRGFSALPDYSQHENLEDQVNLSVSFSISVASQNVLCLVLHNYLHPIVKRVSFDVDLQSFFWLVNGA